MNITRAPVFYFRHFLETHPNFKQTGGLDFSGTGSGSYHANLEVGDLEITETENKIEVTMPAADGHVVFVAERQGTGAQEPQAAQKEPQERQDDPPEPDAAA